MNNTDNRTAEDLLALVRTAAPAVVAPPGLATAVLCTSSRGFGVRRRGAAMAVGAALALSVTGAAAAGGLMPQAFTDAFSGWRSSPNGPSVDPGTARRVASGPGPDGTVFTLMAASAPSRPGYECLVPLYETVASAKQPGPTDFQDAYSNGCEDARPDEPFGTVGLDSNRTEGFAHLGVRHDTEVWTAYAGKAVRAEVRTADGTAYPALVHNGRLFGWAPAPAAGAPRNLLIGYSADGAEVGRIPL